MLLISHPSHLPGWESVCDPTLSSAPWFSADPGETSGGREMGCVEHTDLKKKSACRSLIWEPALPAPA